MGLLSTDEAIEDEQPLAKRLRPSTLADDRHYCVTTNLRRWKENREASMLTKRKTGKRRRVPETQNSNQVDETVDCDNAEPSLSRLSEELLLLILERVPCGGLINLGKTCRLFNRLCRSDAVWRHRCKVDHGLVSRWAEYSYIYLYEMFYKADILRDDQNFFKPVSQLKTSVIVWYLIKREPPCPVVSHLTASQVKSIWGITEEELEEMYFSSKENRVDSFPLCHYEWSKLFDVFVKKHQSVRAMQTFVLKRCLRNKQALEDHYKLSLHTSRRQKWHRYLEDRDFGNREALKALTDYMPEVTYVYMLHQITAMYIDGNLKGGFQTVKEYADFCAQFKGWIDERSLSIWPPRLGEIVAQDYRDVLDYVNSQLAQHAKEKELVATDFMAKAKPYVKRLHEVWRWQNRHNASYRKEHRSTMIVRQHECYRKYLEQGNVSDFVRLQVFFERREILSHWLKENLWLAALLNEGTVHCVRPREFSSEITHTLLNSGPIAHYVQRFLLTGLQRDFDKVRIKLSHLANMQLDSLCKKARFLRHTAYSNRPRLSSETRGHAPGHRPFYFPGVHSGSSRAQSFSWHR